VAKDGSPFCIRPREAPTSTQSGPSGEVRGGERVIAFAGVGKYNEFDSLRVLGVRSADLKGYQFSREDVDARSLANQYAQIIGQTFTHEVKPLEVEILVAELGVNPSGDQLFHIMYDGTVIDEKPFIVIGGDTDTIKTKVAAAFTDNLSLQEVCNLARTALSSDDRKLHPSDLEVTLLQRNGSRRCFKRLAEDSLAALLD
jgi:proteasome alpha subunit